MFFHKKDHSLRVLQNRYLIQMPVYEVNVFEACPPEPEPPEVPDTDADELGTDRRTLWQVLELLAAAMDSDDSS
jgi:hypothetical protein